MKIRKTTLATTTAAIATPVKPSTPAMMAIAKNINTHVNIASVVPATKRSNEATNKIKKIIKMTLAISAAAIAMPVKPKMAATIEIRKNVNTQPNMADLLMLISQNIKFQLPKACINYTPFLWYSN
jgi:hypothetical protein